MNRKGNFTPIELYLFFPAFIIAIGVAITYGILSGIIAFFAVIGMVFVLAYILDKIDELRRLREE